MAFFVDAMPHLSSMGRELAKTKQHAQSTAIEVIHQFPNNTWLENLAVRSNGKLVCMADGSLLGCAICSSLHTNADLRSL